MTVKKLIGQAPSQAPRNRDLGSMAYQDANNYYSTAVQPTFRNKLINGGFDVWQRHTFFGDLSGYGPDRWASSGGPTNTVVQRGSFTPGQTTVPGNPKYYFSTTFNGTTTGAGDRIILRQMVEDYTQFIGKTVILSGWYRKTANLTGESFLFHMKRSSGYYDNCLEISAASLPTTSEWKYFERVVSIPLSVLSGQTMTSTASFAVNYYYQNVSTTGYFDFANLQLEIGSQATPFERRPYGVELALCRRYFQKSYPQGIFGGANTFEGIQGRNGTSNTSYHTTAECIQLVSFKETMRASPTLTVWDGIGNANAVMRTSFGIADYNNQTTYQLREITENQFSLQSGGGSNAACVSCHYYASAEL